MTKREKLEVMTLPFDPEPTVVTESKRATSEDHWDSYEVGGVVVGNPVWTPYSESPRDHRVSDGVRGIPGFDSMIAASADFRKMYEDNPLSFDPVAIPDGAHPVYVSEGDSSIPMEAWQPVPLRRGSLLSFAKVADELEN